jgi:hypothetical protein
MLNDLLQQIARAIPRTGLLLMMTFPATLGAASVTLAWNPTTSPAVAGYRVYQGVQPGNYSNVYEVGTAVSATIPALVPGTTYYFAVTSYTAMELESVFSGEIAFTPSVPTQSRLRLWVTPSGQARLLGDGPVGYRYELLVSTDLRDWKLLANVTMDATGAFQYTDTNATGTGNRFYRLRQTYP